MTQQALGAPPMPDAQDPRPAEDHADYRFFRFLARATARLTVAGLFFIAWAALFATGHRWDTAIFLASTTALLLVASLVTSMVAYMLYKRRGGTIIKGPRSAEELRAGSLDEPVPRQGGQDVPHDEHQRGDDPKEPQDLRA
jgi:hypothetical protein